MSFLNLLVIFKSFAKNNIDAPDRLLWLAEHDEISPVGTINKMRVGDTARAEMDRRRGPQGNSKAESTFWTFALSKVIRIVPILLCKWALFGTRPSVC